MVVSLGTLSVNFLPGPEESGSCKATETTEGDLEPTMSSSLAPEERPVCRKVRDRSTGLVLVLQNVRYGSQTGSEAYFRP